MSDPLKAVHPLFAGLIAQVLAVSPEKRIQHHNPRPPGVIIPGSATSKFLEILRQAHPRALSHGELVEQTGATRGAAAWALHFLRHRGMVEVFGHPENGRYHRYRYYPQPGECHDD